MPVKSGFVSSKDNCIVKKKNVDQSKTEKSSKVIIKAAIPETLVPSSNIQFLQIFFTALTFSFPKSHNILNKVFVDPLFVHSYFKNTFCHHIAINAP